MEITKLVYSIVSSLALLIFGGWILSGGVKMILQKYDWKQPTPGQKGVPGQIPMTGAGAVNQMLFSLNKMLDPSVGRSPFIIRPKDAVPGEATPSEENAPPEDKPADGAGGDTGNTDDSSGDANKGSVLDGVANIIKALPELLKADFGPIVVVCFAGLVVMGAGFYIIVWVINAAG